MPESEQHIFLHELLLLHLFYSAPVLVVGTSVLGLVLVRSRQALALPGLRARRLVVSLLCASVCAYLLALPLWLYWPSRPDFLLAGFFSLPALASTALTVLLFSIVARRRWSRERTASFQTPASAQHSAS